MISSGIRLRRRLGPGMGPRDEVGDWVAAE
jgi:hypothetical protein